MNFLSLCKEVARLAGISDSAPSTVIGQSGELLRVVTWTANAWVEIQDNDQRQWGKYWTWMIDEFTEEVTTNSFSMDSTVDIPLEGSFMCYLTASGRTTAEPLIWKEWTDFRPEFYFSDDAGHPEIITKHPDGTMRLYPDPDGTSYSIEYEAIHKPITLAANADEPDMPDRYHMAIVWRAVQIIAEHLENPAAYETAGINLIRIMDLLENTELTENLLVVRVE